MADRFFPNPMPRFPAEAPSDELVSSHSYSATLIPTELLSLPDAALFDRLRQTALNLKETVPLSTRFVLRNFRWFYAFLGFCFFGLRFVVLGRERDVDVEWKASAGLYFVYWSIRNGFPGFEIVPCF